MDTDRFNHNVDRKVKTEAALVQRVGVITGVERRRDWSDEKKLAIIAESFQDGVVISDVARRHGLRPQQLFNWRNEFRKRSANGLGCGLPSATGGRAEEPVFAPVLIADDRPPTALAEAPAASSAMIEIEFGGATVRLHGGVDSKALAAVLRAVKAIA